MQRVSAEDDDEKAIARDVASLEEAVADLKGAPAHMRVGLAEVLIKRAIELARGAGAGALRAILADDDVRPFVIDDLFRRWLTRDPARAIEVAVDHADAVDTWTFSLFLTRLDPAEARELALVRAQTDTSLVGHIAEQAFVHGDDRFVDLALSRSGSGLEAGCALLARIGTPRARDELIGVSERADDDRVFYFAAAALVDFARDDGDVAGLAALLRTKRGRAYFNANQSPAIVLARHAEAVLAAILDPSDEIDAFVDRIRTRWPT